MIQKGFMSMNIIPRKFLLDDVFNDLLVSKDMEKMKCDIYEEEGNYHIEIDIPGFHKQDITIEIKENYLTVRGEKNIEEESNKNYIRRERIYNSFERSFYLGDASADQIEAEYKDGTLYIVIPKIEPIETKKTIQIK